ncbi:unnamed protein product, partial [Mesorhabditis belari]|uniref:Transposase n=1 Tax=Mesorhabditis belari TaxID=2138241 RepID=A0AAF3F3R1_9BILA
MGGASEKPESDPKPDLHQKKFMLSVFWDMEGVVYWKLLDSKATVNAIKYSEQLGKVNESLKKNRASKSKIVLIHDNARPHVAKLTRSKINSLVWKLLAHSRYSPAPFDYYLFRIMSNELAREHFDSEEAVKNWL